MLTRKSGYRKQDIEKKKKEKLSNLNAFSLSTDVLFSQKIFERANENNKPRDMTANARGWGLRMRARRIFGGKNKTSVERIKFFVCRPDLKASRNSNLCLSCSYRLPQMWLLMELKSTSSCFIICVLNILIMHST